MNNPKLYQSIEDDYDKKGDPDHVYDEIKQKDGEYGNEGWTSYATTSEWLTAFWFTDPYDHLVFIPGGPQVRPRTSSKSNYHRMPSKDCNVEPSCSSNTDTSWVQSRKYITYETVRRLDWLDKACLLVGLPKKERVQARDLKQ